MRQILENVKEGEGERGRGRFMRSEFFSLLIIVNIHLN